MSAFNWKTGPSIMATPHEARKAAQHAKNAGKAINGNGYALVDLGRATKNAISIGSPEASDRTNRIARKL